MLGHEEIAQDLTQEALLQAYLSLANLRDPSRFSSWLYGITLNVCRSYLRNQKVDYLSTAALAGGLRYSGQFPIIEKLDPKRLWRRRNYTPWCWKRSTRYRPRIGQRH